MNRFAALIALILCALALVACGEKPEPEITGVNDEVEFEITGGWKGQLRQRGLKPFSVRVRIASLERSKQNLVSYGGKVRCSGVWDYLGVGETAYRFRETIDRGRGGKCKGSGVVTLTPLTEDRVAYLFRGSGVHSEGTLRRVGSP